jgi:type I site-specific restriction endonuclease
MVFSQLELHSESDVEQKFIVPLLTQVPPLGLGYSSWDFRTKTDIRKLTIGKGTTRKLYYPDYAIVISGLPIMIIEAKAPEEQLSEGYREARLYATEINARYPHKVNPCSRVVATNGRILLCGEWI